MAYTENDPATAVTATLTVNDVDSVNLAGASVQITGNYRVGQDVLSFGGVGGITGTWDSTTGTLTLSGSGTVSEYQSALRSVKYQNTSDSPSGATRTVSFKVSDGQLDSNVVTRTVTVTPVDDAPVIDLSGPIASGNDYAVTFNVGAGPVSIEASTATLTDLDSPTLSSLTVTISNVLDGTNETLLADTAGTSIAQSYANGVLILSGADCAAHYQQVLRTIQYNDTAAAPNTTARQVAFVANDGSTNSNVAYATITVHSDPLPQQEISGSPDARRIRAGDTFNFNVEYTTSDVDKTLTGLGLRIHYNSHVLTFNGFSYMLPNGFVQQQSPVDDTADYDNDPTTDKYILVAWADITGNWPNADLPITLLMPSFTLVSGTATGTSTKINFTRLLHGGIVRVLQPAGHRDISAHRSRYQWRRERHRRHRRRADHAIHVWIPGRRVGERLVWRSLQRGADHAGARRRQQLDAQPAQP